MRKSTDSSDTSGNNRFVIMSDDEILAAWCMCTARDENDSELRKVRAEIRRRKMFLPFN